MRLPCVHCAGTGKVRVSTFSFDARPAPAPRVEPCGFCQVVLIDEAPPLIHPQLLEDLKASEAAYADYLLGPQSIPMTEDTLKGLGEAVDQAAEQLRSRPVFILGDPT